MLQQSATYTTSGCCLVAATSKQALSRISVGGPSGRMEQPFWSETRAAADHVQQRLQRTNHCRNKSTFSSRCRAAVLLLVLWCSSSTTALAPPEQLIDCLKHGQHNQLTTYNNFVDGKPTRLTLASGWWSSKTGAVELSIVTGLTVSRLDQLEAQCRAWQGSLVASVYLVLHIPPGSTGLGEENTALLEDAAAKMEELHAKVESDPSICSLDMLLLVETVSEEPMKWMLPINVLRNYAMMAARTRLVAMVDVDLLPSAGLADWMKLPGNLDYLKQECSQRKVFVLPAFETAPLADTEEAHALARTAAAQSKEGLLKMVEKGQLWQFALKIFKAGHNCTDYPRWFASKQPYGPIGWTKDYEPWFIADRTLMPFYDSVFRGYGWNKVTQVTNTHHTGFKFMVHPTGFLVHRQHSYSKAGTLYQASKKVYEKNIKDNKDKGDKDTSLAGTTHKFRNRVLEQLAAKSYQPVLDDGLKHCLANLPWWTDGQQLGQQPQTDGQQQQQQTMVAAVQTESADAANSALGRMGLFSSAHRRHARARVWLKRQKKTYSGPGKLVL